MLRPGHDPQRLAPAFEGEGRLDSSLSIASLVALFGSLILLALIPSISVVTVSARAAAFGFSHGLFTALGVVAGDIIFILVAIYGLALIATAMGAHFALLKYLGGAYLLWLGVTMWRAEAKTANAQTTRESSWASSFLSGLLITLGDQKAIFFYLGFFPAFLDLSEMTPLDTLIIIAVAMLSVGGAKLFYAALADRAGRFFDNRRAIRAINITAACVIIAVGLALLLKTLTTS